MKNKIAAILIFIGFMILILVALKLNCGKTYKIRIGYSSLTPLHCMIGEIFNHTDILKKHGLKGQIIFFKHGSDQNKICRANGIDATFSCEVPAIYHLAECPDLRIVGTPGSLGRIALVAPEKSGIYSLKDLKNKTILTSGSSSEMVIYNWLLDIGIRDNDVKLVDSGKANDIKSLYDFKADAIVLWDPWLEVFLKKYDFKIVQERLFYSVIVMSQRYLERFPEAAVRYKDALKEALWWASNNKEIVIKWVSEKSGIEQSVAAKVIGLNENWILPENLESAIDFNLTPRAVKILENCNNFVIKRRDVPPDFDIKKRIRQDLFNKN